MHVEWGDFAKESNKLECMNRGWNVFANEVDKIHEESNVELVRRNESLEFKTKINISM